MFDGSRAVATSRRRLVVVALAVGAAVLALCVAGASKPAVASATSKTPSGCGTTTPGSTVLTLSVNGFSRTVYVHIPLKSGDSSPLPLVLNLHGSGATAIDQAEFSGMNFASDAEKFIVAYPQGLIPDGTGFDWNVPNVPLTGDRSVPKGAANDVSFLTKLVGILEGKYCVNPKMVYATGFSGGARMVSQLACDDSTIFAAVAPVSGLRRPTPCPTTRAVPIIAFHGSADPVDPFAGNGEAYWTYSVKTAAKDWAKQNKCSSKVATSPPASSVTLFSYSGCKNGAVVELYEVMGEGHEWPGGPTMPAALVSELGPQSNAINADALMWSFFVAHPLP
ncbi:MAG: PHB depolymerase family esterase [Acidimicrobiales bacterium]